MTSPSTPMGAGSPRATIRKSARPSFRPSRAASWSSLSPPKPPQAAERNSPMRSIRLVAMSDDYDDTPGLVVKGTQPYEGMMADREGTLVAHDILEHQNGYKAIGSVWDELEALGA